MLQNFNKIFFIYIFATPYHAHALIEFTSKFKFKVLLFPPLYQIFIFCNQQGLIERDSAGHEIYQNS
jgi:hypothetical protein